MLASPRSAGLALFAAGALWMLARVPIESLAAPARGALVVAAGLCLAASARPIRGGGSSRPSGQGAGVPSASLPLPFFAAELTGAGRARLDGSLGRDPRPARQSAGLAAMAVLAALAAGESFLTAEHGATSAFARSGTESIVLEHPAAGARRSLGGTLEVASAAVPRDGAAAVRLAFRRDGGEGEREAAATPSRAVRLGDYAWGVVGLVPLTELGRVSLRITPRDGGGSHTVELAPGEMAELPAGGSLQYESGQLAFAGRYGPAVRVVEFSADGAELRREWVLRDWPEQEQRHGSGAHVVDVEWVELDHAVALRATRPTLASMPPALPFALVGLLALVVAALLARRAVRVVGRDGDYVVIATGPDSRAQAEAFAAELLTADQLTEVAAARGVQ